MIKAVLLAALLVAVPLVAVAPAADACMPMYTEVGYGPVKVVKRSSCAAPEVYVNDERVLP